MAAVDSPEAEASGVLGGIRPGSTLGVGSLPHRDGESAARFSLDHFDIAVVPRLPRRSPAEQLVAQAIVGARGVTLGQYGTIAVDVAALDPEAPVVTDLRSDNFAGFRSFLDVASAEGIDARPVKWQLVGPVTLGLSLTRAGAPVDLAFRVASQTVRAHADALCSALEEALPNSPQLMVLDEPLMADLMEHDFPLPPDTAADLLSGTMAVVQDRAAVGVHCCFDADWPSLLEAGPQVISLPARADVVEVAGYIDRFLDGGGWIAWGAISSDGPIGVTATRSWHTLSSIWCDLVRRGSDPSLLRRQSLLSPRSGLAGHTPSVAEDICRSLREISSRVRDQASATRLVFGA
jgi:hypothetical protein